MKNIYLSKWPSRLREFCHGVSSWRYALRMSGPHELSRLPILDYVMPITGNLSIEKKLADPAAQICLFYKYYYIIFLCRVRQFEWRSRDGRFNPAAGSRVAIRRPADCWDGPTWCDGSHIFLAKRSRRPYIRWWHKRTHTRTITLHLCSVDTYTRTHRSGSHTNVKLN